MQRRCIEVERSEKNFRIASRDKRIEIAKEWKTRVGKPWNKEREKSERKREAKWQEKGIRAPNVWSARGLSAYGQ